MRFLAGHQDNMKNCRDLLKSAAGLDHEITIAPDIQQFEELSSFQTRQCFHILTNLPGMAGGKNKEGGR